MHLVPGCISNAPMIASIHAITYPFQDPPSPDVMAVTGRPEEGGTVAAGGGGGGVGGNGNGNGPIDRLQSLRRELAAATWASNSITAHHAGVVAAAGAAVAQAQAGLTRCRAAQAAAVAAAEAAVAEASAALAGAEADAAADVATYAVDKGTAVATGLD